MDSCDYPALFIIVAIEMLFPFAADVDADLVLCALYFEVSIPASTKVVLIHRLTVSGNSFVRPSVTNK